MTHADVLRSLGGVREIAAAMPDVAANTIHTWKKPGRSIPAVYWHRLIALPKAQEVGLTFEQLEHGAAVSRGGNHARSATAA